VDTDGRLPAIARIDRFLDTRKILPAITTIARTAALAARFGLERP
jgi:hypothetical protein